MRILVESQIRSCISMIDAIECVREAFKEMGTGNAQMPPKQYVTFHAHDGDLRSMIAYLEGRDIAGVKVVNSHPKNPASHMMPTVMATIQLNDPKTGAPLALMDGTYITSLRTGAAATLCGGSTRHRLHRWLPRSYLNSYFLKLELSLNCLNNSVWSASRPSVGTPRASPTASPRSIPSTLAKSMLRLRAGGA